MTQCSNDERKDSEDIEDRSPKDLRMNGALSTDFTKNNHTYELSGFPVTVGESGRELCRGNNLIKQNHGKWDRILWDKLVKTNRKKQETLRSSLENDRGLVFAPDEILSTTNRAYPRDITPHPLSICDGKSDDLQWPVPDTNGVLFDTQNLAELIQKNKKKILKLQSRIQIMEMVISRGGWEQNSFIGLEVVEKAIVRSLVCCSIYLGMSRIGYYIDSRTERLSLASVVSLIKQWKMLFSLELKYIVEFVSVIGRSALNIFSVLYISNPQETSKVFGCLLSIVAWKLERTSWKPNRSKIYPLAQNVQSLCTWLYFFNHYLSVRRKPAVRSQD